MNLDRPSRESIISHYYKDAKDSKDLQNYIEAVNKGNMSNNDFESFCRILGGRKCIIFGNDEICDSKDFVLIAHKYNFFWPYHLLSEHLLNDKEIAIKLARCGQQEYWNFSLEIRSDKETMLEAIKVSTNIYPTLSSELRADKDICKEIARKSPELFRHLKNVRKEKRDKIFNDKEIALIAAQKNPNAKFQTFERNRPEYIFKYFSEEICNDKEVLAKLFGDLSDDEIVEELYKNNNLLIGIDSKYWINNEALIKSALTHGVDIYERLTDEQKNDVEIVSLAVENNPSIFKTLPENLRDNKKIVLSTFIEKPFFLRSKKKEIVLKYASESIRDNTTVALKALAYNPQNFQFVSDRLKNEKKFVLKAISKDWRCIEYVSDELCDDKDIISAALKNDSEEVLGFASTRLQDDYEIVYKACKVDGCNLQFASARLQDDKEIVKNAIKNWGGFLEDASERLQKDEELIKIANKNM